MLRGVPGLEPLGHGRLVGSPCTPGVCCSLLTALPRSPPVYITGVWCPEAESTCSWGLEVSSGGRPAACSGGPACLPPLNGVKSGSSGLSQSSCKTTRRKEGEPRPPPWGPFPASPLVSLTEVFFPGSRWGWQLACRRQASV